MRKVIFEKIWDGQIWEFPVLTENDREAAFNERIHIKKEISRLQDKIAKLRHRSHDLEYETSTIEDLPNLTAGTRVKIELATGLKEGKKEKIKRANFFLW